MENKFLGLKRITKDYENCKWPTIAEQFSLAEKAFSQRPCYASYADGELEYTFAQVKDRALKISTFLQEQGVKKGDNVILIGKNSINWAFAYLGITFAGATIVPLDVQIHPERATSIAEFTSATYIIADSDIFKLLNLDLKHSFLDDDSLLKLERISENAHVKVENTDSAAILFTSGTTGNEKGVVLSHINLISDAHIAADDRFMDVRKEDVLYALLPLHHSYCMTAVFLENMVIGCKIVFGHGVIVSRMLNDMKKGKITGFMGIPLLFNKLYIGLMKKVRAKGILVYSYVVLILRFHSLLRKVFKVNLGKKWFKKFLEPIGMMNNKFCICGGGPLSPLTVKRYYRLGLDFVQGYGLTETSPILTLNPVKNFKVLSVGKVLPLVDMKIIDKDVNGVGEIVVKGPNCTKEYYKNPQATKELFTEDGYLKTGDLGFLDKDNYLYIKGRSKNLIVTEGGKNVYPEEIEDAFQFAFKVDQILVRGYKVGNRNEQYESIEALIYPSLENCENKSPEGLKKEIEDVVKEINRSLASYQKIQKVTVVDQPMAMTSTKKIQRNKIQS